MRARTKVDLISHFWQAPQVIDPIFERFLMSALS
jgi:hypothetical protein